MGNEEKRRYTIESEYDVEDDLHCRRRLHVKNEGRILYTSEWYSPTDDDVLVDHDPSYIETSAWLDLNHPGWTMARATNNAYRAVVLVPAGKGPCSDKLTSSSGILTVVDVVALLDKRIAGYRMLGPAMGSHVAKLAKLRADECADVRESLIEKFGDHSRASKLPAVVDENDEEGSR